jgi:FtsH-binding integral membrane protein
VKVDEMTNDVSEARAALLDVERRQRRVIDEIDVPPWYWWLLAGGWVVLGVLAELAPAAASIAATLVFGAVHAAIAPRVLSGQHRSQRLSVRRDLVDRRLPLYVFTGMIALVAVTLGVALVLDADGAGHPSIIAAAFVAVIIVIGGPRLTAAVRRRSMGGS